jgi:Tfp pilus assembly protein PilF
MSATSYEFIARGKLHTERPKLMSGWTLAGFAVLVMIPLVMIFPKQSLLREASHQRLGDLLTINYLTNLLHAEPGNLELRLLLAEHRLQLGETEDILELIQPALDSDDPEWRNKGYLASYKLLFAELRKTAPSSPGYAALQERSKKLFYKISHQQWPLSTLVYLAGQAEGMHEHGVALLLYRAIDEAAEKMPAAWFADAALRSASDGQYELAAHLYFVARHREYTIAGQREYLLAGIKALMMAGLYERAMQAADEHLGNLQNDDETLYSLVQLARTANDQRRAVRYSRLLLHFSLHDAQGLRWQSLALSLIGIAEAHAEPATSEEPQNIRPYDSKKYELAYEVFISNGKLDDAFRVAQAAVRQAPESKVWHQRLAQLAEWLGKPALALREWLWLLKREETQSAIMAILRLAPGLNEHEVLLDAWKRYAAKAELTAEQRATMASLFELTGHQRSGARYFEARYEKSRLAAELETAANLAERNGDDALALAMYARLLKAHGARPVWVLRMANLYLRKSDYRKAYEVMHEHRDQADDKDVVYWKLLADLAWQLQLDDEAKTIYRRLQQGGKLANDDYSRLVYLLDDDKRLEKAALAELAYRHSGDRELLLFALEVHAARHDLQAQKNLFDLVAERGDSALSDNARFRLMRAQYRQARGETAAAREDFRRAAALSPNDPASNNGILWFLIDNHDEAGLREMLGQLLAHGRQNEPVYWGTLAAAYQVLGQPTRAAAYYSRQLKQGKQDFLWLVNYADVLEQAGQGGMATQVRRDAWRQLEARLANKPVVLPFSPDMLAAARLSLLNHPADPALALVRSVLRQDRLVMRDATEDAAINELVLGWAVSTEQSANAKAWLWQRYARSINRPLWAESSVALQGNDRERIAALLASQGEGMSLPVRHDALRSVGRLEEAEAVAWQELAGEPGSTAAHQRLAEDVLSTASFVEFGARDARLGSLHQRGAASRLDMPLGKDTRVAFEYGRTRQSDDVPPPSLVVPAHETVSGIGLRHMGEAGDTRLTVRRRNEYAPGTEVQFKHGLGVMPRLSLQLGAEYHAAAEVSSWLQTFGMRDRLDAALMYHFSKRDYLHVEAGSARYSMQSGAGLGNGHDVAWELAHRFHTEYPDWRVRLIGAHSRFTAAGAAPLALPGDSNLYGVCGGVGENLRQGYTRAWLPWLEYCATRNDVSGSGYNAMLGLAGPVAGADRLALALMQERGGVNLLHGQSRIVTLDYRYYFD